MEFPGDGLDDVLIDLYRMLSDTDGRNEGGTRGPNREALGVTLRIENPRDRLSRSEDRGKPYSALGELLWYLGGNETLEFISPYVPRYKEDAVDGILPGAYGPRLFSMKGSINQISNILGLLTRKPGSRRAVIQLFDASDIAEEKTEIPCTTTLQFHLRDGRLHMSTNMRSNDAYLGLPHDVFCFTMIQEMIATRLGVELGSYIHHAGSMHVYDDNFDAMKSYISEGHQRINPMPRMPAGDPFTEFDKLLIVEDRFRHGEQLRDGERPVVAYWSDISLLLEAFWASGDATRLNKIDELFSNPMYKIYLETRRLSTRRKFRTRIRKDAN